VLQFNDWLSVEKEQNTRATYMAGLIGYLEELATDGIFPPGLSLAEIRACIRRMSRLQPHSSSRVLDLDTDRLSGIPAIVKHFRDVVIPPFDVLNNRNRLLALRNRAIVFILYSTAIRVEELASLSRDDVADGRRARPLIMGKGRKGRTIYLREEAQEAVHAYVTERIDSNPALFVTHGSRERHENRRIDQRVVQRIIQTTRTALDIEADLTPHDFRHYKATSLLRAGMPLEDVQEFLGHEDVSTTRGIYAPVLGVDRIESSLRRFDTSIAEL
jgi:integrase